VYRLKRSGTRRPIGLQRILDPGIEGNIATRAAENSRVTLTIDYFFKFLEKIAVRNRDNVVTNRRGTLGR
jgi:hypothetical protein